jgi:hypothetical protein
VENTTINGEPMENPNSPWIRKPSLIPPENLLPNTWHIGAGLDWLIIRSYAPPPKGIDFSVNLEWNLYTNDLGLDLSDIPVETLLLLGGSPENFPVNTRVTRNEFVLGLTISF